MGGRYFNFNCSLIDIMTPNKQPEWEQVAEKWLEKESVRVSVLTDLQTLIKEIISSHDTYWKERVCKMIKDNTGKNRYRDGETAFDITRDIEQLMKII